MKTIQKLFYLLLLLCVSQIIAQTDAVTILPNGNMGVGTTTPAQKLEVNGNIQSATSFTGLGFYGKDYATFAYKGLGNVKGTYALLQKNTGETFLNASIGQPINFRINNVNKMVIKSDGNVGIGTDNPNAKLFINSDASDPYTVGTNAFTVGSSNAADGRLQIGIDKGYSWLQSHGEKPLVINLGNNVGIGTKTPTQAKLVVSGNAKHKLGKFRWFAYYEGGTGVASGSDQIPYSIYATDRIAAQQFNAFSDARIKHIVGVSTAEKDLETLSKIEITDYKHIDTISKGNQWHKKVIAQQVKEVYPQAVTTDVTEVIPNIYALRTIKDGWIKIDTRDLVVGDKIQLIFSEEEALVDVLEIKEDAIKVASDREGQVFIYGKQVSDFHTVDYEAISMLNVSATQALLKRIELLEADKKKLTGDFEKYKTAVNDRLSKIEQALQTETVMN
ncbi:tail fiber domain-containing protein [Dokdonia ponticola]|uniref:Tail fiber domain-containing protein n=1 Tax=Dokdonia ponticola TaxID=2041041 RepID=A0ABV9HRD1_9FLAO